MSVIKGDSFLNLLLNLSPILRDKLIKLVQEEKAKQNKVEFIVLFGENVDNVNKSVENFGGTLENLGYGFGIITLPVDKIDNISLVDGVNYVELPKALVTSDSVSNKASCVPEIWDNYNLSGNGIVVGFIDSGINYLHPAFKNKDGDTRIEYIYDLSTGGDIYNKEQIQNAINSNNPYSIVKQRDTGGHGTHVASIACGGGNIDRRYYGPAFNSSICMVKATSPGKVNSTKSTQIMRGVKFLIDKSKELAKPLVINLSFSTNDGAHNGSSLFEQYINTIAKMERVTFAIAAGNEGAASHHVGAELRSEQSINVSIGNQEQSILFQLYKGILSDISVEVKDPKSNSTGIIKIKEGFNQVNIGLNQCIIYYTGPKPFDIEGEITISLINNVDDFILPGNWTIKIYLDNEKSSRYDMWLPISEGLNKNTKFLKPNIFNTLGIPGTVEYVVTVGSYNAVTQNISAFSGRGDESNRILKPDVVAPGENIYGAIEGGEFDTQSGTSMATPQVAGICALIMEWGIVKKSDPYLYGSRLKYYLLRGARRGRPLLSYPNAVWGYGEVCLANAIDLIIGDRRLYRQNIETCEAQYIDPNYANHLVEYDGDIVGALDRINEGCAFVLDENYAVVSIRQDKQTEIFKSVKEIVYVEPKRPYTLSAISPIEAANISDFHNNPYLSLRGTGVLIGMIDTGIDYLNREFIYEDDTTKIVSIWDQTINDGKKPEGFIFGSEYKREDINNAIQAKQKGEDPYKIVPSKDEVGHGTAMAGIIAGRNYNGLIGGAPDSEIIMVKAKPTYNEFYEKEIYEVTDLIIAIKYLTLVAKSVNKPIVIYIPLGSALGPHDGNTLIERYIDEISKTRGIIVVTSTGNEGDTDTHVSGRLEKANDYDVLELKVDQKQRNLLFEIWVNKPNKISLSVVSPSGEVIEKIPAKLQEVEEIKFVYEGTRLFVEYFIPEELTGDELIRIKLLDVREGIWQFRLIGDYIVDGKYNAYLNQRALLKGDTRFLNSTPYGTLTIPSTSKYIITNSFYNQSNKTIVPMSGRGFTRDDRIRPDVTAGGVNVPTTSVGGGENSVNGGSAGAAVLASAVALLLQWAIVDGRDPTIYAPKVKTYLIRGATKRPGDVYPNPEWGYGMLNLNGVFEGIRYGCGTCDDLNFLPNNLEEIKKLVLRRN